MPALPPVGAGLPGPSVTPAEQERLARAVVLRQLTASPRTREQLRSKLEERGIEPTVATRVLDRFTEVGLVDDAQYAEMLVRTRRESRGLSRRALAQEMRARGVGAEDAAAALESITAADEEANAVALARRKAHATRGLDRQVRERRIAAMLARKGYPAGVAVRALRAALDEYEEEDPAPFR